MRLVPRQLRRSGMTGNVAYYGGRLTPQQAWAASHPSAWEQPAPPPPPPQPAARPTTPPAEQEAALQRLRDSGVISAAEYDDLSARVSR